jgi:hypothetical protein
VRARGEKRKRLTSGPGVILKFKPKATQLTLASIQPLASKLRKIQENL